jgi:hypothetical protein
VAELLAVVAQGKSILGSISFHPDGNVAEAWLTENLIGLCDPRHGYEEQGQVYNFWTPREVSDGWLSSA